MLFRVKVTIRRVRHAIFSNQANAAGKISEHHAAKQLAVLSTAASVAASVMLVRSVVNELLPHEMRDMLSSSFSYLATRINTNTDMPRLRVSSMDESQDMIVSMEEGEEMADMYEGTEFKWCLISRNISTDSNNNGNGNSQREARSFEVSFHKKHKEKALKSYLPFIVATAKAIKDQERILQIFMNEYNDSWSPIGLHHPSTFDTLAMDKKLLYGPPGTGKSSLIAAMANHLRFDIYDLELTEVNCNSELRRLLVGIANKSILVVEDIDCTIEVC